MSTKIAITNAKGGVAKTTTALNIADALMYIGYKVLFIDLDPQANSTSVYEGTTLRSEGEKTLFDVMEGTSNIKDCIQHTEFGDIVAGDSRLAEKDAEYQVKIGGNKILKKSLKEVDKDYDFIIMDTPPNIGAFMQNAIYAADGCLCPVLPKKFAIDGLGQLLDTIDSIRDDGNEKLKIYGIVLTIYDKRNAQDRDIKEQLPELGENLGFHVFNTEIRTCQDVEKALAECKSLFRTKGNSNGAADYVGLVKELLEVI
ncbi:MAG: ParA family protein [Lachnospiraceae bacterium]|nr:ParA family protein [Lachnospiraceae bacterium]